MSIDELIEYAKRRLAALPESSGWPLQEIAIAACIPAARHECAVKVMQNDAQRGLLQQDYTVALNPAGQGNLLAAVGSVTGLVGEILQEGVNLGVVLDGDNNKLVPLKHYADFLSPQPIVYGYYCLSDKVIRTRAINLQVSTPLDVVSATSPLTVTASYAPMNVSDFPEEIQDDLVGCLVEVVLRKGPDVGAN
jgi:hypothetical protein